MAGENGPFGFDPDDLDRFAREAGEGLREVFGKMFAGNAAPGVWANFVDAAGRRTETRREPATTGQTGSGVWAVFVVDDTGGARVEQVYASELDALRANQYNTDPSRRVRFLPYGIAVSALDGSALESGEDPAGS
ncbi:hypothetical protein [Gordonia sp. NPDC003376]